MKLVKKQNKFVSIVFLAILVFSLFEGTLQFGADLTTKMAAASSSEIDPPFSIIHIGDTQFLSRYYPNSFTELTEWIVANAEKLNLKMVVHTGDIIDTPSNATQANYANTSMSVLLDNGIPYCPTAGNHDHGSPDGVWWLYNYRAFDPDVLESKSYWLDSIFEGKNTAVTFDVGSENFIVIDIEYLANSTVISWMENIMTTHPNSHIIFATHFYRGNTGGYGVGDEITWATNLNTVLNSHSNVFLTMNGHVNEGWDEWAGQAGSREETMMNFQNGTEAGYHESACAAQIFTFDLAGGVCHVRTYLVYNDTELTDSISNTYRDFSFHLNFDLTSGSTVRTSTSAEAIREGCQDKGFQAAGLYWVAYSDGTNEVYCTSADGVTWATPITLAAGTSGTAISIVFDGTYVHWAKAVGRYLYYRRGTPISDGSITWSAAQQTYDFGSGKSATYPSIKIDSNGYAWISFTYNNSVTICPNVIRTGNNDGTFGTPPTGLNPYELSSTSDSSWRTKVVPLTGGKMGVVYSRSSQAVCVKTWSGTAWNVEKQTSNIIFQSYDFSARPQSDDIHIVFTNKTQYFVHYVKYTYATNTLGTEIPIRRCGTTAVSLSIDPATNNLYAIFLDYASKFVSYMKYSANTGLWDTNGTYASDRILANETSEALTSYSAITAFPVSANGVIGVLYETKTGSPYNVKFTKIVTTRCTAISLASPFIVSVGQNLLADSVAFGKYPVYFGVFPSAPVTVTLQSLNTATPSIQFSADGVDALYNFSWSWNMPIVQQVSGYVTSLQVTGYNPSSKTLTFTVGATSATISTTKVYCGSLGQPVTVTPASADGGFDAVTGIQTLVWVHSSPQTFTLDWTPTGGGGGGGGGGTTLYRLAVKVLRGSVPVPQASVSVGSTTYATDSEGVATFSLQRGVYTVTVNLGDETQTRQVDLRSDAEVTFALASGWSFPNLPSVDDGTMRTIVFVGIVLTVMLLLIRRKKVK